MALKKAYTLLSENGVSTDVSLPAAYHRIKAIVIDQETDTAQFTVVIYKNEGARFEGKAPMGVRHFGFSNEPEESSVVSEGESFTTRMAADVLTSGGKNPVGEAYGWLKLHPLYSGASDV